MCGRFTITDTEGLQEFAEKLSLQYDPRRFNPRFNICPSQQVPAILSEEPTKIISVKWGFVPHWASDDSYKNQIANARDDSVAVKQTFKKAFETQRCLMVADGFFEWGKVKGRDKEVPFYFRLKTRDYFVFASLWRKYEKQTTVCLITTSANPLVGEIHHRMPVILERKTYATWLSPDTPIAKLSGLLKQYPANKMRSFEVTNLVNNTRNDRPEVIIPQGKETCS